VFLPRLFWSFGRGISSRGKKVHLSASVLTRGISHHYYLGFDTNRGIKYVKNKKKIEMAETCKNTSKQKYNSASSQNLNTLRVQNLMPTTITSTIM